MSCLVCSPSLGVGGVFCIFPSFAGGFLDLLGLRAAWPPTIWKTKANRLFLSVVEDCPSGCPADQFFACKALLEVCNLYVNFFPLPWPWISREPMLLKAISGLANRASVQPARGFTYIAM